MNKYKYILKLEIICGLALIQKEICCDTYQKMGGTYYFRSFDESYCEGILAVYPIDSTIITSIEENPDYYDIGADEDYGENDYDFDIG